MFSAGTEPNDTILPVVQEAMQEVGIDISGQWSKSVMEYLGNSVFTHVITAGADAEQNCRAVLLNMGIHEHWSFDNPARSVKRIASHMIVKKATVKLSD